MIRLVTLFVNNTVAAKEAVGQKPRDSFSIPKSLKDMCGGFIATDSQSEKFSD
jgi:hypothetical protein